MIKNCFIILGCLTLGELLVYLLGIKFPSSILGMLFLVLFLKLKWVKTPDVKSISEVLISNLGLFFVPSCIKMMLYFPLIAENWLPLIISVVISTILVLLVSGFSFEILRKNKKND